MTLVFYASSAVAVTTALLAVTRANALHALLYLVVTLFALALAFLSLGAPFLAVLLVIVYAGAIMVLILFVLMMLNLGKPSEARERRWLPARAFLMPSILGLGLAASTLAVVLAAPGTAEPGAYIGAREVGSLLFGPYVVAVELASVLLLVGLVGAYYLGTRE